MFHKSFQEMGIPEGYGFNQLLFHPAASTFVVQVRSARTDWRPERLYSRHVNDNHYQPVGAPLPMMSQEYPVVSMQEPLLAYNTVQYSYSRDAEGKERLGGDWDSLKIYDLAARRLAQSIGKQTLQLPEGATDCWISSILGFCRSEDELHVRVALSRNERRNIEYYVAKLHAEQRSLDLITLLPAVFM